MNLACSSGSEARSNAAFRARLSLLLTCWIISLGNLSTIIGSGYLFSGSGDFNGIGKSVGSVGSAYSILNWQPFKLGIWL